MRHRRRVVIPIRNAMRIWGKHTLANAFASCFESLGFESAQMDIGSIGRLAFRPGDVAFFIDLASARMKLGMAKRCGCFAAMYNMEPVEGLPHLDGDFNSRFSSYRKRLVSCEFDAIFDYNANTTSRLREDGAAAHLLPMGYHESYELEPGSPFNDGCHWLGLEFHPPPKKGPDPHLRDRRGQICEDLRSAGLSTYSHNFRGETDRGGMSLRRLVHSPGVHLNLHRPSPPFQFGGIRVINFLMSNRRFVLSEPCLWYPEGLTAGTHWDVAPEAEFVERARFWLDRPKKRREVAESGYEFIKKHHRLDHFVERAFLEAGILKA